jgi:hypothetical protein
MARAASIRSGMSGVTRRISGLSIALRLRIAAV